MSRRQIKFGVKNQRHQAACNESGSKRKCKSKQAFSGMVPVGERGIDLSVRMMNQMKPPKKFDFMFYSMNQISIYEIEQE